MGATSTIGMTPTVRWVVPPSLPPPEDDDPPLSALHATVVVRAARTATGVSRRRMEAPLPDGSVERTGVRSGCRSQPLTGRGVRDGRLAVRRLAGRVGLSAAA